MIRIYPDNAIYDPENAEVINSTHAQAAQDPLVQALAEALTFKGAMDFTGLPVIQLGKANGRFAVDGREISPDDDASGETAEIQTALNVFYGEDRDSEYAATYRLSQSEPDPTPEPMTPGRARAAKLMQINSDCDDAMQPAKNGYTQREIDGWPQQEAEMLAYYADSNNSTPIIDALASARSLSRAVIASRIQAKVAAFKVIYGNAVGQKQARLDALDEIDLESPDAIQQIDAV